MKIFFTCILMISIISSYSQEKEEVDSLSIGSEFIKDYTNQLNINFEVSNEITSFKIPLNGSSVKIEPNIGLRYALVFNYRFASLRLGVRPNQGNDDEKGDPKTFRLKFKLLFDKWSHHFEYNQVKGYYVSDEDFIQTYAGNHFIFPDLKTKVFTGTTAYKLNDDYSIRANVSHTEAQLKSAGSFLPSLTYTFYGISGLDNYSDENGDPIQRTNYNDNNGFSTIFNIGYHYTFVYHKWYATIYASPGIGYDFRKVTEYSSSNKTKENHNAFLTSLNSGIGVGYNNKEIFFGTTFNYYKTDFKHSEQQVEFLTSENSFFLFFGYRFKAPKMVTKSIDKIEETIPVLKKD